MISDAVAAGRVSRVVGYKLQKGFPPLSGVNLPQRIAILGPANAAEEATAPSVATEILSAAEAGNLYGYGSTIHQIARILRPINSDGVGAIPTFVYRQAAPGGAVAASRSLTVTAATVTANVTHYVKINGRASLDGSAYAVGITTDDDADSIAVKVAAAVTAILGAPVTAAVNGVTTNQVDITAKFAGTLSEELSVEVDTGSNAAGVTYAVASLAVGSGDHVVSPTTFGNEWNTIVINPYGANTAALDALEFINGVPDPDTPTGNYAAIRYTPFVALFGSTDATISNVKVVTTPRKDEVTNVVCPAPNSKGTTAEAAANVASLLAIQAQNSPHLDTAGKSYPDMPTPSDGDIGDYADYSLRDDSAKNGASTVDLVSDVYEVQDLVTTYHPEGENPPSFRFVRSLVQDFNVAYGYRLREDIYVRDKAIASNDQIVEVGDVIKPKQWVQVQRAYADDLSARAIITDADFMKESILVGTSDTNPDRLETFFRYKRSPFTRIASTTAEANFAFNL